MSRATWFLFLGGVSLLAGTPRALAQARPYAGFVYPAGGQQGTTIQLRLGGQALDDVNDVQVTGPGVSGRIVQYFRNFNPQDMQLISEQLRELKRNASASASMMSMSMSPMAPSMSPMNPVMAAAGAAPPAGPALPGGADEETLRMIARIEKRIAEYSNWPACSSIANIAIAEVTIAPDAPPGERELRVATLKGGASNPLSFHVGQLPEVSRKPMLTSYHQTLGKEELALRKRPVDEIEDRVLVPCVLNGQVGSGEVNRYRFEARKGQKLVITALARQLIPYVADAVPGWFQPVMVLTDATGKELAYGDDYRFRPDPIILFEVPQDGEYLLGIYDAIYRGREDFVYRITIGETPFITSIFPLGSKLGDPIAIKMKGWNLEKAQLDALPKDLAPGAYSLAATGAHGLVSNRVPYALGTLPEGKEPSSANQSPQQVTLPILVNGRIDSRDDWDVFQFSGKAGETVVAEVYARRLDSPLDSVLKLMDSTGKLLAFCDDREDIGAGTNTHHSDAYLMAKLPADGTYSVHLGDTARNGGEEYGYRLRISAPQPDFELRVVPSSITMRSKSAASAVVHVIRKDGFNAPIKLTLKDPPPGFLSSPVTLTTQEKVGFTVKTDLTNTAHSVALTIIGTAKVGEQEIVHEAVPAEDRMQAFLWRHLVPAQDFKVHVYDPAYESPPKRARAFQASNQPDCPK